MSPDNTTLSCENKCGSKPCQQTTLNQHQTVVGLMSLHDIYEESMWAQCNDMTLIKNPC